MSNIFFTSDLHFNHDKDFIWRARGFSSVEEMNEAIINRYNLMVKDDDIVYILGDCILGELEPGLEYLKRLKGKKYLTYGNHDTDNRLKAFKDNNIFEEISMGYRIRVKKKIFILSHYYQSVVNFESKAPIWSIHGHTHQEKNFNENFYHGYHAGIDSHNCFPVKLEDIISDIKEEEKNVKKENV